MRNVELRSDTFTLPTEEMLQAIKTAQLGDDVHQEDPTVKKLEELAGDKIGKEEALLVTSGTQGNLISLLAQTLPGDRIILEEKCHIYNYEVGSLSAIAGLLAWPLKGNYGALDPEDVKNALRQKNIHIAEAKIVTLEDTHNLAGGTIISPEQIAIVAEVAHENGLLLHIDGARIFNAAVALNRDVKDFTKHSDSVMFCLSKGLSAPIGSIVAGSEDFVEKARRYRKMLGGGMRQAGIIAAPGIIALEKMIPRLKEDHENARLLAEGLRNFDELNIDMKTVQTNFIQVDLKQSILTPSSLTSLLEAEGVKVSPIHGTTKIRMVTHRGVKRADIEYTIEAVKRILEKEKSRIR